MGGIVEEEDEVDGGFEEEEEDWFDLGSFEGVRRARTKRSDPRPREAINEEEEDEVEDEEDDDGNEEIMEVDAAAGDLRLRD